MFTVLTSDERSFATILKHDIRLLCSVIKKHKANPAWELAVNYCLQLPQGSSRLYSHLVSEYNGDHAKTAKWMTKQLDMHFKNGHELHFEVSIDKFMVDWDIKQLLEKYLGCNGGTIWSLMAKNVCYKDFPGQRGDITHVAY